MNMKLIDYVKDKKQTTFKFSSSEIKTSEASGEKIAILHLSEPIEIVTGSQYIGEGEDRERMQAYDVETISIYQRDMGDEGINIEPDGSGEVSSDLQLDIANSGEVWLTSKSFRAFAQEKSRERGSDRKAGVYNRMQDRKAKRELKKTIGDDTTGSGKEDPKPVVGSEVKPDAKAEKAGAGGSAKKS
jgi:hypothetical protein